MPNEVLIMGDVPKPQVVLDRECLAVYDAAGSIIIWNFVQNSWSEVCTDIYDAIGACVSLLSVFHGNDHPRSSECSMKMSS